MASGINAARRKQLEAWLDRRKARYVTVAGVDVNGQIRGKLLSRAVFSTGLKEETVLVPEALIALDVGDQILTAERVLELDIPFEDQRMRIDVESQRQLPFYPTYSDAFFFSECLADNTGHYYDPRAVYHKIEARLAALSLIPIQGFEYEFRIYRETMHRAIEKKLQNLRTLTATAGYSNVLHQSLANEFIFGLLDTCSTLDVPVITAHFEHGVSMLEMALGRQKSIRAPDNAVLFKTFTKVHANRHDLLASFLAKPNAEEDGASMHAHLSLVGPKGRNVFYSARELHNISETMRHFLGGIQKLLPELFLLLTPNVNSMRRFVADHFAPVAATWGVQNRTAAIRVISGSRIAQRLELRVAGADANPHFVLACLIGAGTWGIERKLEPGEGIELSSWERLNAVPKSLRFPTTFQQAIDRFRGSRVARELFGDDFVDIYAGTRQSQLDELRDTRGRTSWRAERERFLLGA